MRGHGGEIVDLFAGPGGSLPSRIVARIAITETACWHVSGYANGNGYTRTTYAGRRWYLHRLSYTLLVGPIPDGLHLDHLCRNRACINPAHLEPVTNEENIRRGESRPAQNARKQQCPRCGGEYADQSDGTRRCLKCRFERRVARGETSGRGAPADRTHCPYGHPYDEENTVLVRRPDGSIKQRACRECSRQRVRARRAAARARGGDA